MKIHELIKILQSHPNPEADVMITVNLEDTDDDKDDVSLLYLEVWNQDEFFEDFIEIFATEEEEEAK
jgi:hypothetical protein